jgi:hypothetical protein
VCNKYNYAKTWKYQEEDECSKECCQIFPKNCQWIRIQSDSDLYPSLGQSQHTHSRHAHSLSFFSRRPPQLSPQSCQIYKLIIFTISYFLMQRVHVFKLLAVSQVNISRRVCARKHMATLVLAVRQSSSHLRWLLKRRVAGRPGLTRT